MLFRKRSPSGYTQARYLLVREIEFSRSIYLHEATGRRLTFSEAVKQMKECRVRSETVVLKMSFSEAVQGLLEDDTLDPEDREHLERLRADFRVQEHWKAIEKTPEVVTSEATPGDLIWQVLVGRRVARFVGEFPAREEQARNAEKLAGFFRRTGEAREFDCRLLDDLASRLREPEDYRFLKVASIPVSRKSRHTSAGKATKNSREIKAFINWMVGYIGGLKQSSQHSEVGGCDGHWKATIGTVWTSTITFPRTAASSRAI